MMVLLRSVALSAVIVVAWVVARVTPADPLFLGVLVFLGLTIISAVWSAVDVRRHPAPRALLTWLAAAVLTGLAMAAAATFTDDTTTLGENVTGLLPMIAGMVFVPALLGTGVGRLLRGRQPA